MQIRRRLKIRLLLPTNCVAFVLVPVQCRNQNFEVISVVIDIYFYEKGHSFV